MEDDRSKDLENFRQKWMQELKTSKQDEHETPAVCSLQSPVDLHVRKNELLDILLKDLDEINEIPFFDTELPRELALKIFQHLEIRDLCACCLVSRAWKSLAEDELLWCWISQAHGWDLDTPAGQETNWKDRVRDHYLTNKKVYLNWKMRTGLLHQLHYVQGGVLCCVASHGSQIVAGYTSGELRYWDVLQAGEECTLHPSSSALVLDESSEEGTISNYPTQVAVNATLTAAGYSQGIVDVWNKATTQSVHSFRGPQDVTWLDLSAHNTLAVAWGDHIRVLNPDKDGKFHKLDSLDMPFKVKCACQVTTSKDRGQPLLVMGLGDMLLAHKCGEPQTAIRTLHHTYHQSVRCLDHRDQQVAVGINDHSTLQANYNVKLYCLERGQESGRMGDHLASVSVIDIQHSPPHLCVTGSVDRKVRVCDERIGEVVMVLAGGHHDKVTRVQMDDWKVVSGGVDGYVCLWDQRMTHKLWDMYNRHPVKYIQFDETVMVTANIPNNKFPDTDEDKMAPKRFRGNLEVFDFSADQITQGIPSICSSTFDEPMGYNYNIGLAVPYDNI